MKTLSCGQLVTNAFRNYFSFIQSITDMIRQQPYKVTGLNLYTLSLAVYFILFLFGFIVHIQAPTISYDYS